MFTGIVDHRGKVMEVVGAGGGSLSLCIGTEFSELVPGESIAVDGACLTVTSVVPGGFWCDVSPETLKLTIAGRYRPGALLNLERALRFSDRMGGHWVTGHVDGRAKVRAREMAGEFLKVSFADFDPGFRRYLLKKGSVAVNGVSLTLNEVTESGFDVMLVPHTLQKTTLAMLGAGEEVNLELDWMVKVILSDRDRRLAWIEEK